MTNAASDSAAIETPQEPPRRTRVRRGEVHRRAGDGHARSVGRPVREGRGAARHHALPASLRADGRRARQSRVWRRAARRRGAEGRRPERRRASRSARSAPAGRCGRSWRSRALLGVAVLAGVAARGPRGGGAVRGVRASRRPSCSRAAAAARRAAASARAGRCRADVRGAGRARWPRSPCSPAAGIPLLAAAGVVLAAAAAPAAAPRAARRRSTSPARVRRARLAAPRSRPA